MTTTAPDIHVLSADSTRADVIEALGHVVVSSPHWCGRLMAWARIARRAGPGGRCETCCGADDD